MQENPKKAVPINLRKNCDYPQKFAVTKFLTFPQYFVKVAYS